VNRRFPLLALAPLLVLSSCSAFKLSENGGASSRTSFGRSVAEGRGLSLPPTATVKPEPVPPVVTPTPAPATTQPAPVVANPTEKVEAPQTSETKPVKPADRPATTKRHAEQDADQLRLPGDLLNQLPGEKDYKPSNSGANEGAPVIAKPPGAR
jgi:outer membrane biosynthesis protein TonB